MKRFALILAAVFMALSGFAQEKFTEEDVKQFYRTMLGDYTVIVNDSTTAKAHFTPIWENMGNRFQWMYVEVELNKKAILQKVIEVRPKNDKVFRVYVHDLKNPEQFVGKWGNRNYFDGFTPSILKSGKRMTFLKTSDFSYQTDSGPRRFGFIGCFPKGDLLHFKFVQADERFFIKRIPNRTSRIIGYQGIKDLTD